MASDSQEEESAISNQDVGKKPAAVHTKFKKIGKSGATQNQDYDDASGGESRHVGKSLRKGNKSESWQEMFGSKHKHDKVVERKRAGLEEEESRVTSLKGVLEKEDVATTDKVEKCKEGPGSVGGKGRSSGEIVRDRSEDGCREKTKAREERSPKIARLEHCPVEQATTLKGILSSRGILKVAVTGLSAGQNKRCLLPSSLLVDVRNADLLFVKCSDNGVPLPTANFYLGRAYGVQVANASFLLDWEEKQQLPRLENYLVVFGSYLKRGELVPLKPIREHIFIGQIFCITSLKGSDHPEDLTMELIIRMGGRIVDEKSEEKKIHYIGNEWMAGMTILRPEWIFDSVEQGSVLKKARFIIEPAEDQDGEAVFSQVRHTELYSCKVMQLTVENLR